jgi:hypothetical protein
LFLLYFGGDQKVEIIMLNLPTLKATAGKLDSASVFRQNCKVRFRVKPGMTLFSKRLMILT